MAEIICDYQRLEEGALEECNVGHTWGGGRDLACDLWFENETAKSILIVQTKHKRGKNALDPNSYADFLDAWDVHRDYDAVCEKGNDDIKRRLANFQEKLNDGWTVEYKIGRASCRERV